MTSKRLEHVKDVCLTFEFMDKDLKKVIGEGSNDILTVDHIKFIMYQLVVGLKYVHSAHVIHRDLKPANILMKIADCSLKIAGRAGKLLYICV